MNRTAPLDLGRASSRAAAAAVLLSSLVWTHAATSEDAKQRCVAASTEGQKQRDAGKLLESRKLLLACASEQCPPIVTRYCAQWAAEVEAKTPSVVVRAQNASGADVDDVSVRVDDELIAEKLDGRAVALNPGQRLFRFECQGAPPVTRRLVIAEGEKARAIHVRFETGCGVAPVAPPPRAAVHPLIWVLGGVGVAALGSFTYFAITGKNDLDQLKETCAPSCPEDDRASVRNRFIAADVSLGVSVLALGGATWWFLASRPGPDRRSVGWTVKPMAGGMVGGLGGSF